jgi:hypothetical protein
MEYDDFEQEDHYAPLATPTDACREYARNVGFKNQDHAWILTDYDTWESNPFYHGPAVRHPEDDYDEDEEVVAADEVECPF